MIRIQKFVKVKLEVFNLSLYSNDHNLYSILVMAPLLPSFCAGKKLTNLKI